MSVATTLTAQDVVDAFNAKVSDMLDNIEDVRYGWSSPATFAKYVRFTEGMSIRVDSERCVVVTVPESDVSGWGMLGADILDMVLVDLDTDGSLFDGEIVTLGPRSCGYVW